MLAGLVALAAQSVVMIGNFAFAEGTDPMDDSAWMGAMLQSDDADLVIGCEHSRAKTIYVVLKTKRSLAYTTSPLLAYLMPFEYRVDQEKSVFEPVSYGVDTVRLEGAMARAFAERLARGSKIAVRVNGHSGPITAEFPAKGSREAIGRIAQRCGDGRLTKRLARP